MPVVFNTLTVTQVPSPGLSITLQATNTSVDTTSITIPETAAAGDIAVLFSYCRGLASTGGGTPAGWTGISDLTQGSSLTGIRALAAYKVLAAGEPGSSVTGLLFGGQEEIQHIRIYRPTGSNGGAAISTPTIQGKILSSSDGSMTNQTVGVLSTLTGYVVLAMYNVSSGSPSYTFTPAQDTQDTLGGGELVIRTKVYTAEDLKSSHTINMNYSGGQINAILLSFAIRAVSPIE